MDEAELADRREAPVSCQQPSDVCRFCYEPGGDGAAGRMGPLLAPCRCEGSLRYVHPECLRRWQVSILLNAPTHPDEMRGESRHTHCNVCQASFSTPPPSREQLLREKIGEEMCTMLRPGNLLIRRPMHALPDSFRRLPPAIAALMQLKRAHWERGVYLITEAQQPGQPYGELISCPTPDSEDKVCAINLTRSMAAEGTDPPGGPREHGTCTNPMVRLSFFNGGPVEWSHGRLAVAPATCRNASRGEVPSVSSPSAVPSPSAHLPTLPLADGSMLAIGSVMEVTRLLASQLPSAAAPSLMGDERGGLEAGLPVLAEQWDMRVYCGHGKWRWEQLLGEIARGDWWLTEATVRDVVHPIPRQLWEDVQSGARNLVKPLPPPGKSREGEDGIEVSRAEG